MAKLGALSAYVYQAALAFGLLILVSNLLPAVEYTAYSLFVSITQFAAIAAFEWIRFAVSRFYPGPDDASESAERGVVVFEFLVSSALCVVATVVAPAFGVPIWMAAIGCVVAIAQGGTELHLTMLRFRHAFSRFSWLQGARASLIAFGTLGGALVGRDLPHLLAGLLIGYGAYLLCATLLSRHLPPLRPRWDAPVSRRHAVYGSVAAGASVAGMLAPLGLKAILTGALGAQGAAASLLALDLLQRPFVLIVSALQAIRYPDLVSLFDRDGASPALRDELGRYYAILSTFSLIGGAGLMALLALATRLAIPLDMQSSFLRAAPFITLMALLRALIQTLLPTPAHLQRRLKAIAGLAVADAALMCAGAFAATLLVPGSDLAIAAGAAVGAGLALLGGSVMLGLLPFRMPWMPVGLALVALIASSTSARLLAGDLWLGTGIALAFVALFGTQPLLQVVRWVVR